MKKFIIDRFEGNYAVCEAEDKTMVSIPKYKLPLDCKEGDCLVSDSEGMLQKDNEPKKTKERRIQEKLNRLFNN